MSLRLDYRKASPVRIGRLVPFLFLAAFCAGIRAQADPEPDKECVVKEANFKCSVPADWDTSGSDLPGRKNEFLWHAMRLSDVGGAFKVITSPAPVEDVDSPEWRKTYRDQLIKNRWEVLKEQEGTIQGSKAWVIIVREHSNQGETVDIETINFIADGKLYEITIGPLGKDFKMMPECEKILNSFRLLPATAGGAR